MVVCAVGSDTHNHRIRSYDLVTDTLSTVAGTGVAGHSDGKIGDVQFNAPTDVTIDPVDRAIIVADTGNHCIRRIDGPQQNAYTIAGTPGKTGWKDSLSSADTLFNAPQGIVCDLMSTLR